MVSGDRARTLTSFTHRPIGLAVAALGLAAAGLLWGCNPRRETASSSYPVRIIDPPGEATTNSSTDPDPPSDPVTDAGGLPTTPAPAAGEVGAPRPAAPAPGGSAPSEPGWMSGDPNRQRGSLWEHLDAEAQSPSPGGAGAIPVGPSDLDGPGPNPGLP